MCFCLLGFYFVVLLESENDFGLLGLGFRMGVYVIIFYFLLVELKLMFNWF